MDVATCLRRACGALLLPGLAACGGGLYIGIGGGGGDFGAPSISLAAAQSSVQAGATLQLVAAASDENGIDSVAFYRLDSSGALRLGSDGSEPYQWALVVPNDGRSTLQVFARATDGVGNQADSSVVTVVVTP